MKNFFQSDFALIVFFAISTWLMSKLLLKHLKSSSEESLKLDKAKNYEDKIHTKKPNRFQQSLPKDFIYCYWLWNVVFSTFVFILNLTIFLKISAITGFLILNFWASTYLFSKNFNAKKHFEKFQVRILSLTASIGIFITLLIFAIILLEAMKFFHQVHWYEFLFGINWQPQMAMTSEQEVGNSSFGAVPVFVGSLLITVVAIFIALPIGIMAAIYLSNYASTSTRNWLKPVIEILAGVPTVVYGYFAVIAVAPLFKSLFTRAGFEISAESALAAGSVMGIMIIPSILSLADDAFNAVPQSLKDGALALGSTKSEMITKVAIPTAMPGLVAALILAVSRAIGETMIVVMAAGLVANLTFNPLNSVTTATVQIVSLLTGDQEFNSPKTLSAFALALLLFAITFALNFVALKVSKNFEKKYG